MNKRPDPMDDVKAKPLWLILSLLGVIAVFVLYMVLWRFILVP